MLYSNMISGNSLPRHHNLEKLVFKRGLLKVSDSICFHPLICQLRDQIVNSGDYILGGGFTLLEDALARSGFAEGRNCLQEYNSQAFGSTTQLSMDGIKSSLMLSTSPSGASFRFRITEELLLSCDDFLHLIRESIGQIQKFSLSATDIHNIYFLFNSTEDPHFLLDFDLFMCVLRVKLADLIILQLFL